MRSEVARLRANVAEGMEHARDPFFRLGATGCFALALIVLGFILGDSVMPKNLLHGAFLFTWGFMFHALADAAQTKKGAGARV